MSQPLDALEAAVAVELHVVDRDHGQPRALAAPALRELQDADLPPGTRLAAGPGRAHLTLAVEGRGPAGEPLARARQVVEAWLEAEGAGLLGGGLHPRRLGPAGPGEDLGPWALDPEDTVDAAAGALGDAWRWLASRVDLRRPGFSLARAARLVLPLEGPAGFAPRWAALRALAPLVPGLAASSPLAGGRVHGAASARLAAWGARAPSLPALSGRWIPEALDDPSAWSRQEGAALRAALASGEPAAADPPGEGDGRAGGRSPASNRALDEAASLADGRWLVVRPGAGVVELRAQDPQESAPADAAVASVLLGALDRLERGAGAGAPALARLETERLAAVGHEVMVGGDEARVTDVGYLDALGLGRRSRFARDAWEGLIERGVAEDACWSRVGPWCELYLSRGTLARRVQDSLDGRLDGRAMGALVQRLWRVGAEGGLLA